MRRLLTLIIALGLAALAVTWVSHAHAAAPSVGSISPRGGQRGTEVAITLQGGRIADAQELYCYDAGLTVANLQAVSDSQTKATLRIAADAPIGEKRMRLRCAGGWSFLFTFYVGALPTVAEKEPNGDFASPQSVDMNVTVAGVVTNEDVDYYVVEAKKGQRITAEVEGIRLGISNGFDPYVAILDSKRFELAASDDTALLRQDPSASAIAPEDGKYIIMVRESAYGGSDNCQYRVHIGDLPRPRAVYPLGGQAGQTLAVHYLGDKSGPIAASIKLPDHPRDIMPVVAEQNGQLSPSPNWLRVSSFPNAMEAEPNDSIEQATRCDQPLPLAFNGVISKPGDRDFFRFKGVKGQALHFRVHARTLRTPLDSVLNLYNGTGGHLAGNDDEGGPDSAFNYTFPDDGEFVLGIQDHLLRGGEDFAYRIEAAPLQPALSLRIPEIGRNDMQTRQWAAIPRGNRTMTLMVAGRANIGGDMAISCPNLPAGVTLQSPIVRGNMSTFPLVFEAAADAPIAGLLSDLLIRPTDTANPTVGQFYQGCVLVRGYPNEVPYYSTTVGRLATAVTTASPFKVDLVEPKAPLVHAGVLSVKVTAQRAEGFDGPIVLELPFRSPGVSGPPTVTIEKGKSEASYTLQANGDAAQGDWPLVFQAHADTKEGPVYTATQLGKITVGPAVMGGQIPMAATEQGKPADVVCKLNVQTPFEGQATLQLVGLPGGCEAAPLQIDKEAKEAVFKVTVLPEAPVGQHRSLFCQVSLTMQGETVSQTFAGGGVLRIDKPRVVEAPPPPPPAPAAQANAAPAPPPAPKRLSRLEQLRLEQKNKEGRP